MLKEWGKRAWNVSPRFHNPFSLAATCKQLYAETHLLLLTRAKMITFEYGTNF
jgi:hypothetical protein